MDRRCNQREKRIANLSQTNRWYQYERYKKYLSSPNRETEAKLLSKSLKI